MTDGILDLVEQILQCLNMLSMEDSTINDICLAV